MRPFDIREIDYLSPHLKGKTREVSGEGESRVYHPAKLLKPYIDWTDLSGSWLPHLAKNRSSRGT